MKNPRSACGQAPAYRSVIKGRAGNVIVVKTPNPMFTEAIFILKDDVFSGRGLGRKEILKQARDAAKEYTAEVRPPYPRWLQMLFSAVLGGLVTAGLMLVLA